MNSKNDDGTVQMAYDMLRQQLNNSDKNKLTKKADESNKKVQNATPDSDDQLDSVIRGNSSAIADGLNALAASIDRLAKAIREMR